VVQPFDDVVAALDLEPVGDGRYRAGNIASPGQVVFGGQILAQTIVAAARTVPGKEVRSVHTVFAKGASLDAGLDIEVDTMADGRAVASTTVTVRQGDRLCSRSLVLLSVDEPDLVRHGPEMPAVDGPTNAHPGHEPWWELAVVGDVDFSDPALIGPAELPVWTRVIGSVDDPAVNQALLAYATDGFLIATAMRPHEGVGQALAHQSISTSVLTHTLTFHEPVDAHAWHLLAHESPYAGRGRAYGRAHVFTEDGRVVASYTQESLLRANPRWDPSQAPSRY
jgi:acyl-CoA thioesterase